MNKSSYNYYVVIIPCFIWGLHKKYTKHNDLTIFLIYKKREDMICPCELVMTRWLTFDATLLPLQETEQVHEDNDCPVW